MYREAIGTVDLATDRSGDPVCVRRTAVAAGTRAFALQLTTSTRGWINAALLKPGGRRAYCTWGYHPSEQRWAYGQVPPAAVVDAVRAFAARA